MPHPAPPAKKIVPAAKPGAEPGPHTDTPRRTSSSTNSPNNGSTDDRAGEDQSRFNNEDYNDDNLEGRTMWPTTFSKDGPAPTTKEGGEPNTRIGGSPESRRGPPKASNER